MDLKLPPVVVTAIFAGLMYMLVLWLPVGRFEFFGRQTLIWATFGLALLVALVAIIQFLRKSTTLNPQHPQKTTELITSGIYNYSRNPMYLAMLLVLIAWGLYLQNAFNTLTVAIFVFYVNRFQIIPEERALEEKFGKEYSWYKKLVRRWF